MYEQITSINKPIRVLHVIGSMNLGGAETMIMNLYRKIDKSKVQFDFLLHIPEKSVYEDEIKSLGGRVFRIKKFKGIDPIRYYNDCCKFFLRHPEIKIVHGHIGSCAALYLDAAKKYGCYTIAHSHSALKAKSLRDLMFYIWSFPTRFIANQLFGCSTEAGIARFGKKAVKSDYYMNFNNGIDINLFKFSTEKRIKIRNEFGIEGKTVIGTVGRLTPPKNPNMIYEIFKRVIQMDNNAVCIWVGTGELWDFFANKVKIDDLSNKIIMTGPRTDVSDIMQAFDAFVFPSLWEGLPVSVIEAQASGLPCILSSTISKEVEVSRLVKWVNLDEDVDIWAEICLDEANNIIHKGRKCPIKEIQSAGYDINNTAKWLQEFYIEKG